MSYILDEMDNDYFALWDLIVEYNYYVINYPKSHDVEGGQYPVCLEEFYDNEYQAILEARKFEQKLEEDDDEQ